MKRFGLGAVAMLMLSAPLDVNARSGDGDRFFSGNGLSLDGEQPLVRSRASSAGIDNTLGLPFNGPALDGLIFKERSGDAVVKARLSVRRSGGAAFAACRLAGRVDDRSGEALRAPRGVSRRRVERTA